MRLTERDASQEKVRLSKRTQSQHSTESLSFAAIDIGATALGELLLDVGKCLNSKLKIFARVSG